MAFHRIGDPEGIAPRIMDQVASRAGGDFTFLCRGNASWESPSVGVLDFRISWTSQGMGVHLHGVDGEKVTLDRYLAVETDSEGFGIDEVADAAIALLDEMVAEATGPWDAHLPERDPLQSGADFEDGLSVRRWPHECLGAVLYLQSSGLTVVPHRSHDGSFDCMVVESALSAYPVGQGISVGTRELVRAIARPLAGRST